MDAGKPAKAVKDVVENAAEKVTDLLTPDVPGSPGSAPATVEDLVANNIPVFFIQDGVKFPDVIHAGKPHPDREIPQAQSAHDTFWDFVSLHTEAQHHTMWNMSDRGIPRSYRMMEGFGVHTFRLVDEASPPTSVTCRRASTSPTTRCCRRGCSPTSTPRSPGWAARTSRRSRSTGRTARSTTCSGTASISTPYTPGSRPTGRTRWTAATRSSPVTPRTRSPTPRSRSPGRGRSAPTPVVSGTPGVVSGDSATEVFTAVRRLMAAHRVWERFPASVA